jgi:hypothetical protein
MTTPARTAETRTVSDETPFIEWRRSKVRGFDAHVEVANIGPYELKVRTDYTGKSVHLSPGFITWRPDARRRPPTDDQCKQVAIRLAYRAALKAERELYELQPIANVYQFTPPGKP